MNKVKRERESSTQNLQFSPRGLCTRGIPTNHQNSDLGADLSSFNQNSPHTKGGRGQATPQGQTPCSVAKVSWPKHELGGGCERNEWEEKQLWSRWSCCAETPGMRRDNPRAQVFPSRLQWQKTERDFIECCHLLVLTVWGKPGFSPGPGSALSAGEWTEKSTSKTFPKEQILDSYPRITPVIPYKSLSWGLGKAPICDTLDTQNYLHLWNIHSPAVIWVFNHL